MKQVQIVDAISPWLQPQEGPLRAHLTLAIRQAIAIGRLPQGTRLPPERALATALNVSRPTISAVIEELRGLGLVESRQGSGSWVSAVAVSTRPPIPFAELVQTAGAIDLAAATAPDATVLPSLKVDTADMLSAQPANGFSPSGTHDLRSIVAQRVSRFVPADAENVIVTAGAHQALALILATLTTARDTVLLEETTYGGLVDLSYGAGCHPFPISRDEDGPQPEHLADQIAKHRPSVVVLISPVHAPTGTCSSDERCRQIADILADFDGHIVLDETFGDLEFTESDRSLSRLLGSRAIRIGSLSKSLWSGLRIGWIVAEQATCQQVSRRRWQQFDLGSSLPAELFAARALTGLDEILVSRRATLRDRSNWAQEQIATRFPEWNVHRTDGGLTLWAQIPVDGQTFATAALKHDVAVLPGAACRVDQKSTPHIRVCFDRPVDVLEEAFSRLEQTDIG